MTDEHPHTVTQRMRAMVEQHGMVELAFAFMRTYWPALSVVVTVIVAGTISVMKIDEILAGYKAQAQLNTSFAQQIMQLRADQRADIHAINEKIDAVAKSQGETNNGLDALFKAARITVTPIPKPAEPPKKRR